MIRKSVSRFSEKIMLKQKDRAGCRFEEKSSRYSLLSATKREAPMSEAIDLDQKLSTFSDHWSPRTVAQFNACDVMVVKVKGEFVWHKHDDTDDFFLVLKGVLDIQLRDRTVTLKPGQIYIVPKGVEHRPVAQEEVHLLLIEPSGTPNTGNAETAAPRKLA
jgi:mannose-6-phosphate isomerase-like protein (cupin superfamily)